MRLFGRGERTEEQPRLAIMVGETRGADAKFVALLVFPRPTRKAGKAGHRAFARAAVLAGFVQAVRLVIAPTLRHFALHMPVALEIHHRAFGRIDRQLVEIGAAQPLQLRVEIAEQPALQQRIVGKIDTGDNIGRAIGDLLGLGEEIVGRAVEYHAADDPHRQHFLGN